MIGAGQGRLGWVVGVHTDCALPLGRPVSGNSGDGLTVLVALVIRLSQKTSRALELEAAGFGFLVGGFLCAAGAGSPSGGVLGNSKCTVVGRSQTPDASLRITASPAV